MRTLMANRSKSERLTGLNKYHFNIKIVTLHASDKSNKSTWPKLFQTFANRKMSLHQK